MEASKKRIVTSHPPKRDSLLLHPSQQGFTLIEILIALVILSTSLVVVFGLQSASTSATIRNGKAQRALFLAQAMMSHIETSEDEVQVQEKTGSAGSVFQNLSKVGIQGFDPELLSEFQVDYKVAFWDMAGIQKNSLKRISFRIYWGTHSNEEIQLVYFIPTEIEEDG